MPPVDLDYGVTFQTCVTVENPSDVRERFLGFCEDRILLQKLNNIRVVDSIQHVVACTNYIVLGQYNIPEDIIFHYTSKDVLASILDKGHLWLSHYGSMNDFAEIEYSLNILWHCIQGKIDKMATLGVYKAVRNALMDDLYIYLTSFSRAPNLLSQWRAYAPEDGVSIGFAAQMFRSKEFPDVELILDDVIYDETIQFEKMSSLAVHIAEIIGRFHRNISNLECEVRKLRNEFCRVGAFLKHSGFSEEREVRLVAFGDGMPRHTRQGRYGPVEFVKLNLGSLFSATDELDVPICYVITGPSRDADAAVKAVADLFYRFKTKFYAVFDCAIPLR